MKLAGRAAAREGVWVIFEASGGYDRVLRDGLEAAGSPGAVQSDTTRSVVITERGGVWHSRKIAPGRS